MILDGHQHFWALANPFTDWPTADLAPIHRDFLPSDFPAAAAVWGTILVQAAPDRAETAWLLRLAQDHPLVRGVVGWADLAAPDAPVQIAALAQEPLLKGLRPMLQGLDDPRWILRADVADGLDAMARHGLRLDALVRAPQLPVIAQLAARHPTLRIVLDHAGKPDIAGNGHATWARDLAALSGHGNVWCKLSGLWTEAGGQTDDATIAPYVDEVLACFGPDRVIWGSDWPVLHLAGDYHDWLAQCRRLLSGFNETEQAQVFLHNGVGFYGLATS
ncbi:MULTISPECIES: amidohydrolase [unclassified Novosphingobium]|uniref:amidohydrolase family protein n=1 Tax=unclassified Novosphingobium TaxID=2644732 RepID=UPI000D31376B|nr:MULTISPECIES: amidohydrolase family protein [unclassified Novosphingobium]PTR12383.1 L-fuconolactonase [Novosphingobium sp. GV055]PUB05784.1 L-fuconolactonase [Novosphingobium sp. GV061]PUB22017.1 L-fuconolactonase [Novosphingobium sp. GV079]PUB43790.1 L-fuconolactonase [Novosphingobium sp. GV027]